MSDRSNAWSIYFVHFVIHCSYSCVITFNRSQTTVLYRHIRNDEDAAALQKDLTSLQQWEETWQMQFHPQKCNVIHVANKRKPITHSYKLHDHILEVMENSKYLGVTINNKLNWTQYITNIKDKASRTLGF